MPANEGFIGICDGLQRDLTVDGRYRDCRLSHDKLVSDCVVPLTELSDTPVPLSTVRVGDFDCGVNSTSSTIGPFSALYNSWCQFLQFPVSDLLPNISDSSGEDCTFCVRAGAWNHRLDALKEHTSNHLGHSTQTCGFYFLDHLFLAKIFFFNF